MRVLRALTLACAIDILHGHGEDTRDPDLERAVELIDFNDDLRDALRQAVSLLQEVQA